MSNKKNSTKLGLSRNAFKKNRRWEVDNLDGDLGYVKQLKAQAKSKDPRLVQEAKEALEFLSKFNNEYYDNHGLKNEDSLHNSEELRKDCYSRTNAANRDVYGIKMSGGEGVIIFDEFSHDDKRAVLDNMSSSSDDNQTDALDEILDYKMAQEKKASKKKSKK